MGENFNSSGGNGVDGDGANSETGWGELTELAGESNVVGEIRPADEVALGDNLEVPEKDKTRKRLFWRIGNLAHGLFKRKKNISGDSAELISDPANENSQDESVPSEMPEDTIALNEPKDIEEPDKPLFDAEIQAGFKSVSDAKRKYLQAQRKQELLERDLNARLTTVEKLEEEVEARTPGISKRFIEYDGVSIPVYDLSGLPFEMLSCGISERPVKDPSMWLRELEEVKKNVHYGRKFEGSNETICTSYINSETNITTRQRFCEVAYGFSHVDAGSVIDLGDRDINSPTIYGKGAIRIKDENALRNLQNIVSIRGYNEVVLSRFSETGVPRRPDYIITENGFITDVVKTHAAFFGIPIVNFALGPYLDKVAGRVMPVLDRVTDDSSWDYIDSILREVQNIPDITVFDQRSKIKEIDDGELGRKLKSEPKYKNGFNGCLEKLQRLEVLEAIKRVEHMAELLEENIRICREATADKKRFGTDVKIKKIVTISWFVGPSGKVFEVGSWGELREIEDPQVPQIYISLDFSNDIGHSISSTIKSAQKDNASQENSYYGKLAPLVKEFIDAIRENKEAYARRQTN